MTVFFSARKEMVLKLEAALGSWCPDTDCFCRDSNDLGFAELFGELMMVVMTLS